MFETVNIDFRPEMPQSSEADDRSTLGVEKIPRSSENSNLNDCDLNINEFVWMNADNSPKILRKTFALRYSVYCLERNFLNPDHYNNNCETDEFDNTSIHLAIQHKLCSDVAATARIVVSDTPDQHAQTLPLYRYCDVEPKTQDLLTNSNKIGEVSRFAMSKSAIYNAVNAQRMTLEKNSDDLTLAPTPTSASFSAILSLYKSIYQTSRLNGINYLLAAMEKSLRRLFQKFYFPFHKIGGEVDYYGPVAPFLLDLDELDSVLSKKLPWLLAEFRCGLSDNPLACESGARLASETMAV